MVEVVGLLPHRVSVAGFGPPVSEVPFPANADDRPTELNTLARCTTAWGSPELGLVLSREVPTLFTRSAPAGSHKRSGKVVVACRLMLNTATKGLYPMGADGSRTCQV